MAAESPPQGLLLDIDGVFYVGETAVPGGAEVIEWLDSSDIPYLFVTNTTSHPRSFLADKLNRLGVPATTERILSPAVAAREWLVEHRRTPVALFVPEATATEFAGLDVLDPTAESGAASVVVGELGPAWDFARMNRAFRLLIAEQRPALVSLGMTRYWRDSDGLTLDVGPFTQALSFASGAEPIITGKPDPAFFHVAAQWLGMLPPQIVMVGDDIRGDVQGAQHAGMRGVLVRTGKFHADDLTSGISPDAVLGSVADVPKWWPAR